MSFDLQAVTFFEEIRSILQQARQNAYTAVNSAMVEAYWQIGRRIVEEEQKGQERADYGKRLLQELARQLTGEFGKGFSVTNLKLMRQFYLGQKGLIGQTLSDQFSPNSPTKKQLARTFPLSWSHYVLLLGIQNETERSFYELEAAQQNWSVRELKRQFNSSLYERLALSREKSEVMRLAQQGQILRRSISALSPFQGRAKRKTSRLDC